MNEAERTGIGVFINSLQSTVAVPCFQMEGSIELIKVHYMQLVGK